MDVGWPNVEIVWKMANSQLLFLALGNTSLGRMYVCHHKHEWDVIVIM